MSISAYVPRKVRIERARRRRNAFSAYSMLGLFMFLAAFMALTTRIAS